MNFIRQFLAPQPRVIILVKEGPFREKESRDKFNAILATYEASHGVKFLLLEGDWQVHEVAA